MPCTAAQRGSRGTTLLLHAMDAGGCVESELFPEESGGYILHTCQVVSYTVGGVPTRSHSSPHSMSASICLE